MSLGDVKCCSWYFLYLVLGIPNYSVPRLEHYSGRCYRNQEKNDLIFHCSCSFSDFSTVIPGILQSQQKSNHMQRVSAVLPVK